MVNLVCVWKIRIVNQTSGLTLPRFCWAWLTDAGVGVKAGGELISSWHPSRAEYATDLSACDNGAVVARSEVWIKTV